MTPANHPRLVALRWLKSTGRDAGDLCGVNELGVWWNDKAGSTHLEPWEKVRMALNTPSGRTGEGEQ